MTGPWAVIDRHGSYVVARLSGDLDIANVEQVRLHILDSMPSDGHGLIVDLSSTRYVDSAGVHMLFALVRRLEAKRQAVAVAVPEGSPVATLLKITNVSEAAPVCSTVEECAEALREDPGLY
jgi:stage II sporulation protein AA (anti-sigma F factor antagonist)